MQTNALLADRASIAATPTAVDAQPFQPTQRAIVVNTLWLIALVVSLLSALLATLVQDWTRECIKTRGRSTAETSLRRLREQMGIERYGLDGLSSFVIILLHSALVLFLVGMSLFVSTLDFVPAVAVAILSVVAVSVYIAASLIPLVDQYCPYHTPLTSILFTSYYSLSALLWCSALYLVFVGLTAHSCITKRRFNRRLLNPWLTMRFMKQPSHSSQLLRRLVGAIIRRKSIEHLIQIIDCAFEPTRGVTSINGKEAASIWARTGQYQADNPDALRVFALRVLNMENEGVPKFVANLRNNRKIMTKLAILLQRVDSVPAAVGSIRFFQMLLLADSPVDTLTQDDEDWRWPHMDAFLRAYPAFVEQLRERNEEALREECLDVVVAVCSLRWVFILLLWRIRGNSRASLGVGSIAMAKLQYLFSTLDSVANLRMCNVSSDHRGIEELFVTHDPRLELELASRNALTLLEGAYRCRWRGDWQKPDSPYLPKGSPGLWDWRKVFGPNGPGPKPAASNSLLVLLKDGHFDTFEGGFGHFAISALRDLASIVEFQVPPQPTAIGERRVQNSSAGVASPEMRYFSLSDSDSLDSPASHNARRSHVYIADSESDIIALTAPGKSSIDHISERSAPYE